MRIGRGGACLYRLNSQLGKLDNYNPRMISAAQKDITRILANMFIHLLERKCDVKWFGAVGVFGQTRFNDVFHVVVRSCSFYSLFLSTPFWASGHRHDLHLFLKIYRF